MARFRPWRTALPSTSRLPSLTWAVRCTRPTLRSRRPARANPPRRACCASARATTEAIGRSAARTRPRVAPRTTSHSARANALSGTIVRPLAPFDSFRSGKAAALGGLGRFSTRRGGRQCGRRGFRDGRRAGSGRRKRRRGTGGATTNGWWEGGRPALTPRLSAPSHALGGAWTVRDPAEWAAPVATLRGLPCRRPLCGRSRTAQRSRVPRGVWATLAKSNDFNAERGLLASLQA